MGHCCHLQKNHTCQQASIIGSLTAREDRFNEYTHLSLGRITSAHYAEAERLVAGSFVKVHRQVDALLKA